MPLTQATHDTSLTGLGIVLPNPTDIRTPPPNDNAPVFANRAPPSSQGDPIPRSSLRMRSLSNVENGRSMVRINPYDRVSGFKEGSVIHLDDEESIKTKHGSSIKRSLGPLRSRSASNLIPYRKHSVTQPPDHTDLDSSSELASNESFSSLDNSPLLELDLQLENNTVVEGSSLNGWITIRNPKTSAVLLAGSPTIRVIGFEAVYNVRHTFFQHSSLLELASPSLANILESSPVFDGSKAIPGGKYMIPFSFYIPPSLGAKGSVTAQSRVNVRYIILVSFKCRDTDGRTRPTKCIAHFYRTCHVFPLLDLARVLASEPLPLTRSSSKTLFLGGPGKLKMTCTLYQKTWVAGQQCWVRVELCNDTTKRVKSLAFTLYRHTTTFRMMPQLNPGDLAEIDIDSCVSSTTRHKLVDVVLEGIKGSKDAVSGKGWWCGVESKSESAVVHGVLLPSDALTITRSQLLEINYVLRVAAHTTSLTADLNVELPITIVSFISLCPPPSPVESSFLRLNSERQHLATIDDSTSHGQRVARRHSSHDESIPLSLRSLYSAEDRLASVSSFPLETNHSEDLSTKNHPPLSQYHATARPQPRPQEHRRSLPDTRSLPRITRLSTDSSQTAGTSGKGIKRSRNIQYQPNIPDASFDSDGEVGGLVRSTPLHGFEADAPSLGSIFGAEYGFTDATPDHPSCSETYVHGGHPSTLSLGDQRDSKLRSQRPALLGPRSRSQMQTNNSSSNSQFQLKKSHTLPPEEYVSEGDRSTLRGSAEEDDRPFRNANVVQFAVRSDTPEALSNDETASLPLPGDSPRTISRQPNKIPATPTKKHLEVYSQSLRCSRPESELSGNSADNQQTGSHFRTSASTSIQERIAKLEMAGLGSEK